MTHTAETKSARKIISTAHGNDQRRKAAAYEFRQMTMDGAIAAEENNHIVRPAKGWFGIRKSSYPPFNRAAPGCFLKRPDVPGRTSWSEDGDGPHVRR
jgi:hypothetical protein